MYLITSNVVIVVFVLMFVAGTGIFQGMLNEAGIKAELSVLLVIREKGLFVCCFSRDMFIHSQHAFLINVFSFQPLILLCTSMHISVCACMNYNYFSNVYIIVIR